MKLQPFCSSHILSLICWLISVAQTSNQTCLLSHLPLDPPLASPAPGPGVFVFSSVQRALASGGHPHHPGQKQQGMTQLQSMIHGPSWFWLSTKSNPPSLLSARPEGFSIRHAATLHRDCPAALHSILPITPDWPGEVLITALHVQRPSATSWAPTHQVCSSSLGFKSLQTLGSFLPSQTILPLPLQGEPHPWVLSELHQPKKEKGRVHTIKRQSPSYSFLGFV